VLTREVLSQTLLAWKNDEIVGYRENEEER
jgi:hypothetical protein